jgi:hypothetical protein
MYESIYKNNEVENEVSLDMSYFWYSDECMVSSSVLLGCQSSSVSSSDERGVILWLCLMAFLIVKTASVSLLCCTAFCSEEVKEPAEKLSSEG